MFEVQNGIYKSVKMDWDNITLPLAAGSPVSLEGVVSNDEDAIGIVPQSVTIKPVIPEMYILVGGDVDLDEVEESFGDDLEDAAISAMDGIRFFDNGTPVDNAVLPTIDPEEDEGKILTVVDGEWAAAPASGGGGLTLYGPYYATNAENVSIGNGHSSSVILTDYVDEDSTPVSFPADTPFNTFLIGFYSGNGKCPATSVYAPSYNSEGGVFDASFEMLNCKGSDVNISARSIVVAFLSTVELTAS